MFRHVWRPAAVAAGCALLAILSHAATPILQARARIETIINAGLVNPRGLNFGPEGALYIAEAGSGALPTAQDPPCIVNSNGEFSCYGPTGAVTRVTLGGKASWGRVVTGLPSLAAPASDEGPGGGGATGPHDVGFQGRGNGYVTIGAGLDPHRRIDDGPNNTAFAAVGLKFGRLVRFQPNGKWSFQEDLSEFEDEANPDGNAKDSNPYGLLALPGRQVFTDAGGNSLNAVAANGSIANLGVFPNRLVQSPFGPPGVQIPMQAVPTTVAEAPNGDFFVGQLTGFPFPVGGANVYRVSKGGNVSVFAGGFTNIIDIAVAKDGSVYVLEIAAYGLLSNRPEGALFKVSADGQTTTPIVEPGEGLMMPGGVAIGDDGALYVTNWSVLPGGGQLLKIVP